MKQIAVTEQELKWLIKHVNFQNNIKLYQKLISYVRDEECVVTNKAYIVNTLNEDKPQIVEEYDLHIDHNKNEEPLLAFHTKEQYFTDPVRHKIYFSEHGFIFYTDGKAIYSVNRENGKTEITGYDNVKSSDCLLDIRHEVPYLKIQDEYFWPITGSEEKFNKELLEARVRLNAKSDEEICPKCKNSVLVQDDTLPGNNSFFCPSCESSLRQEPHGWVIN